MILSRTDFAKGRVAPPSVRNSPGSVHEMICVLPLVETFLNADVFSEDCVKARILADFQTHPLNALRERRFASVATHNVTRTARRMCVHMHSTGPRRFLPNPCLPEYRLGKSVITVPVLFRNFVLTDIPVDDPTAGNRFSSDVVWF